ncbi:hypothetical protein XELAEV_18000556mg [Xenopus laevis]|nr:hypothetical protein XELAEV_18000556mg [Xenopus laevis]
MRPRQRLGNVKVTCFQSSLISPSPFSSVLPPSPHLSINCQCDSTTISQLFVSDSLCQSAPDLCHLLLLITRLV